MPSPCLVLTTTLVASVDGEGVTSLAVAAGGSIVVPLVEFRRAPGRHDRGEYSGDHCHDRQRDQLASGDLQAIPSSASAFDTSAAKNLPSGSPAAASINAVITLSWRTMRRTWRRVSPRSCSSAPR